MKFAVVVESEAVGGFSVSVPALPGCASQGETIEEALSNVAEAVTVFLESLTEDRIT